MSNFPNPAASAPPPQGYPAPPYSPPGYNPYGGQPGFGVPVPSPYPMGGARADYARWGKRVGALLIDRIPSLIASVVFVVAYGMFLMVVVQQGTNGSAPPDFGAAIVVGSIAGALTLASLGWDIYNRWIVAGRTGQSLGKRVTKIKLVSEVTGQPIGGLNAFCRDLVHILDGAAYVGYLWPLWDDKRQTFADMLMKTIVVDAPAARP